MKFSVVPLTTLANLIAFIPWCPAGGESGSDDETTYFTYRDRAGFVRLSAGVAWVAHVRIVLFVAVPEVVCHGLPDSSLGKLAYTSRSAVSLYTVYT